VVFNVSLLFMEATEFDGSEIDFPEAVVDLFEADVLLSEEMADVDPAGVPTDAAVATDAADLEVSGVLEGRQLYGERPGDATLFIAVRPVAFIESSDCC
jgi:hypothetical protein